MTTADRIAAALRPIAPNGNLFGEDIAPINLIAANWDARPVAKPPADGLTLRGALEIVEHEAIVLEMYFDSVGVATWGIGVTSTSGHSVARYKDNPQTVQHVLEVYIWLLRTKYMPEVKKAFGDHVLSEQELAAATSYHYNTGAILKTDWVKLFLAGNRKAARDHLETHYLNSGDLTKRRKQEAALFFDGAWIGDGRVIVWPVKKPSYSPDWANPKLVDIRADMEKALTA
jgi:lysozyme